MSSSNVFKDKANTICRGLKVKKKNCNTFVITITFFLYPSSLLAIVGHNVAYSSVVFKFCILPLYWQLWDTVLLILLWFSNFVSFLSTGNCATQCSNSSVLFKFCILPIYWQLWDTVLLILLWFSNFVSFLSTGNCGTECWFFYAFQISYGMLNVSRAHFLIRYNQQHQKEHSPFWYRKITIMEY